MLFIYKWFFMNFPKALFSETIKNIYLQKSDT